MITKMFEDAKTDWLQLVKKHSRKQKGLPALSTLNTNAGNVEHNVNMFNKMNSPTEGPSNNPISGPFGGDVSVSSGGMGESYLMENKTMNENSINLEYTGLVINYPIEDVDDGGYYDSNFGAYLPHNEGKEIKLRVDWTYTVDKDEVIEVLADLGEVQIEYGFDEIPEEQYIALIDRDFNNLFSQYEEQILEYFKSFARADAEENYEHTVDPEYNGVPHRTEDLYESVDDAFDMSMRTLL